MVADTKPFRNGNQQKMAWGGAGGQEPPPGQAAVEQVPDEGDVDGVAAPALLLEERELVEILMGWVAVLINSLSSPTHRPPPSHKVGPHPC